MKDQEVDIASLFNQAWAELFCPPVRLALEKPRYQTPDIARFSAVNGTVHIKSDLVPLGCDPNRYLLWYFRHELAHVHHCPYDIRTAYSLERSAHEVVDDWSLAYLATHIFSDVQIDLNYLPRRFGDLPYHARIIGNQPRSLAEQIMKEIYLYVHPTTKSEDKELAETAKEILTVSLLDKTWQNKVQIIAHILRRLRDRNPKMLSKKKVDKFIEENPLHVKEDMFHSSLEMFTDTYGSISDETAAKEFFRQWVEPRFTDEEKERTEKMIQDTLEATKGIPEKKKEGKDIGKVEELKMLDKTQSRPDIIVEAPSSDIYGTEPRLPTSMSKPYEKVKSEIVNEVFWKRHWYKSRAERTIIQYLTESQKYRPVWSIIKYPDEWYIEDEIESLDIETSLDEGPLIPEVTTIKWVEEPTPHGQSMVSGFVPSAITVLDASLSMAPVRKEAAVSAFIALLSARRAGGQTVAISFSTGYISTGWESPEETKELTLSMDFGEFTVFPSNEIKRLIQENQGPCFIIIITDGGWQNVDEAVHFLESMADSGHKVIVFLLKGEEYADRIALIKRTPNLRLFRITNPETDLQGLVLSESMSTYKTFLT